MAVKGARVSSTMLMQTKKEILAVSFAIGVFFVGSLFGTTTSFAQSLTTQVDSLNEQAWRCRHNCIELGIAKARKALQLSVKSNYVLGAGDAHARLGVLFKNLGTLDSAERHYRMSVKWRLRSNSQEEVAKAYGNLGIFFWHMGRYDSAIIYQDTCLKIRKANGNSINLAKSYDNMAHLHHLQGNSALARHFYRQELNLLEHDDKEKRLGYCLNNLGEFHYSNLYFDSAQTYFEMGLKYFREQKDSLWMAKTFSNIGLCKIGLDSLESAKVYISKCLSYARKVGNRELELSTVSNFLYLLLNDKDSRLVDTSKSFLDQNIWLIKTIESRRQAYAVLYEICQLKGDCKSALEYFKLKTALNDSLFNLEKSKVIEDYRVKYETERVELEKEKAQAKNRKLLIIVIASLALLFIASLLVALYRQRLNAKTQLAEKTESLHQKEVDELLKEKQLEKVTALMEGEEKERSRIARELHDGLGSLLSTVKHHFQIVETKLETNLDQFGKTKELLDDACDEVRRISHDMASNVLSKFGLTAALQDLVETVNSSYPRVKLSLFISGLEDRLESSKEIHLYRIIQETISNILKHAKASEASVQLILHESLLNLMVEDNGIGFQPSTNDGMGLENIKARVAHLKGTLHIDSTPGHGTTITIDLPV